MVFGFIAYLISFLIFYISVNYTFFIFAIIAFGVGEAFRSGTHKAMILDYLKTKNLQNIKTRYYGGTRSWSQFGSAVSSLIAMTIVIISKDYKNLFLITMVPYLIDLINLMTYPAFLNGKKQFKKSSDWKSELWKEVLQTWHEFIDLFKSKVTLKAMFSASSYIAIFKFAKDYLQPILEITVTSIPVLLAYQQNQRTAVIIGVTYFIIYLLTSTASKNAWRIEQMLKNLTPAINYTYLAGIGMLGFSGLFLYFDKPVVAVLFFTGIYIFQNIRRTLIISYLSDLIGPRVMASGLSAESQLQTILIVIFAPVLGWIADSAGIAYGLMITSLIFVLIFPLLKLSKT